MDIQHHAASALVSSKDSFLFGGYDQTYPLPVFRGTVCVLGGNARNDSSPVGTLTRELTEEFQPHLSTETETIGDIIDSSQVKFHSPTYRDQRRFADRSLISELRETILAKMEPKQDFLVSIRGKEMMKSKDLHYINSLYSVEIPHELFTRVVETLDTGHEVRNEGFTRAVSLEELVTGKVRGAWGNGGLLSFVLKQKIPEFNFITVKPLDKPLASYKDYKKTYRYGRDPEGD